MQRVPVLIIGGSLVGLSASVFLSWRGVKNVVVDKYPGSSPHPRAVGYTEHTMEFFRAVGLADRIPQIESHARLRRLRVESLAGHWIEETHWTPESAAGARSAETLSPCRGAAIAQDTLEPLLRARATELGSELQLGVELVDFHQDEGGVVAQLRERLTGRQYQIRAAYMIAADGAGSSVRERLGIRRQGRGEIQTLRSVLFRCAQADEFLRRGYQQFEIEQTDFSAFLTTYHDGRWVLMFKDDRERSEAELCSAIRRALGADMDFEILTSGRWQMAGLVAERYAEGRVFLAGDAAHQLPPTRGGFGANTGIDDAYNLAWKLQLVVNGCAAPALLDTYNEERQPIGWLRHQQTFARPDYARFGAGVADSEPLYSDAAMELGQLLRSTSIVGAGADLPAAAHPLDWAGQPGVRAPHLWIRRGGERISSVDLFTRNFTLISADRHWIEAARDVSRDLGLPIDTLLVGEDIHVDGDLGFEAAFGVTSSGASLVRPDGVVGWRSVTMVDKPQALLGDALRQMGRLL
ncbi:FAD-dependent monooxygenase [Microbulbifer sp. SAOS-129_SWC]|uniref:FAD-dependent monooxygenase n=1 Tax=Microbulbifer sp. SAOS-129_SWC TaxID=3145235 RepID=UPI0032163D1A